MLFNTLLTIHAKLSPTFTKPICNSFNEHKSFDSTPLQIIDKHNRDTSNIKLTNKQRFCDYEKS